MCRANGFANGGHVKRVRMTLATTEYIQSYGGFQLSLENLKSMRQTLMMQTVQARLSHDGRRPLRVENVKAEIERRADGEYALWIEFDADEERWAEYEAERDAQGAPGGLSFTLAETFYELEGRNGPTAVSVVVAGDAGHFTDEQIQAAADALADVGAVKGSRLYQFEAVSTALALVQFVLQQGAQVPANVFASWLYDALRRLKPGRETPALDLQVIEDGRGRRTTAHIPAQTDPEVAKYAIEAWASVANRPGTWEWKPDEGWGMIQD
jgi:hypothetical protein